MAGDAAATGVAEMSTNNRGDRTMPGFDGTGPRGGGAGTGRGLGLCGRGRARGAGRGNRRLFGFAGGTADDTEDSFLQQQMTALQEQLAAISEKLASLGQERK